MGNIYLCHAGNSKKKSAFLLEKGRMYSLDCLKGKNLLICSKFFNFQADSYRRGSVCMRKNKKSQLAIFFKKKSGNLPRVPGPKVIDFFQLSLA